MQVPVVTNDRGAGSRCTVAEAVKIAVSEREASARRAAKLPQEGRGQRQGWLSTAPSFVGLSGLHCHERSNNSTLRGAAVNLLKMIRIVLWSFLGIRRGTAHQADIAGVRLPFVAVVLAAGFGAILFALAKLAVNVAH